MTDKINVKIEVGGYTITGVAGDTSTHIVADDKTKPAWIGKGSSCFSVWTGSGNLGASNFFFIESDVPGKLHKFKGVEYLGLVDVPRDYQKMLKDLLEKFKGALVIYRDNDVLIIHRDTPILSGCGSIAQCITGGKGACNLMPHGVRSEIGRTYAICASTVSLEMEAAAKSLGNEFIKGYERLMAL